MSTSAAARIARHGGSNTMGCSMTEKGGALFTSTRNKAVPLFK